MKKLIYIILTGISFTLSCKKYNSLTDDVNGQLYVRGRLFYNRDLAKSDTLTPLPLAAKVVKIGYAKDNGVNYIYSVTSDADGYFTFTNLQANTAYLIFGQDTEDSTIFYKQQTIGPITASTTTTLILAPSDSLQNGLAYSISDAGSNAVSGCQVCLFRSQALLQTGNCSLAAYSITSNANGIAYKVNMAPGQYYSLLKLKIDSVTSLSAQDNFTIGVTGIARRSISIQ